MNLDELKNFLRVDHDLDDSLLSILQETAENYILGAIDAEAKDVINDTRFKLAVTLLVANWYENRNAVSDTTKQEVPFGVVSLIHQLRGV